MNSPQPDVWARWPDDFMCPIEEVEEFLRPPCARSDDYELIEVVEYDPEDGTPLSWTHRRKP